MLIILLKKKYIVIILLKTYYFVVNAVVVVRLLRPMEGNGVTPIFRSLLYRTVSSTTGGWSRWNILMCFIYIYLNYLTHLYIYISF